ncbi:xanthosine triphosphate pyrophosphatase protein [Mycoavidus cysteinexigens]|uniref:dITP/XTP pyrophosphatase n=1 Tax=Mycoavidus cysteinexigens TaxID=1553431 RepID=A0A2Z6ETD9_9BURK|nr:RdgB/HAM1 family non-canonical purine NTP pyrophosphatase [Mycoavidus cysteinexigens]BBE08660.1 xanthosine triphosphate pyrophosphatase protein [Mycoavidus cysteinexigens]GAM52632.1 nucleoside 5-triphosphatase RdgB [bacterium endosymbiont of Mortierella elongata FMR23-6]GLR01476.1 non-canonical purine NTP pyrophosphatase [Mycoavidus cysteinexigens]
MDPTTLSSSTRLSPAAPSPHQVVLASNNANKLREFTALLAQVDLPLVAQSELGITPAAEPHPTFVENALAKARHAAHLSGLAALADDSGLCVHALQGAPGVYSARFAQRAGGAQTDAANNALLLSELAAHPDRRAHYICVLVYVAHAQDPEPIIAEARWYGEIAKVARGEYGFGYDPLFYLPELGQTAAELAPAVKNTISHRALASELLIKRLKNERMKGL